MFGGVKKSRPGIGRPFAEGLGTGRNDFGDEEVGSVNEFAPGGAGNAADLDAFAEVERGHVEDDFGRDIFGQAGDDDVAGCRTQFTAEADADGFTIETDGHADLNLAGGIDGVEVGVENAARNRFALDAFDHDFTANFFSRFVGGDEIKDDIGTIFRGEDALQFERIDRGGQGIDTTAIAYDGNATGNAEAAIDAFVARLTDFTFEFQVCHNKKSLVCNPNSPVIGETQLVAL